jgi:hypothetical protein
MMRVARPTHIRQLVLAAAILAAASAPALAQNEDKQDDNDNSRGVRIIDAPTPPPAPAVPVPAVAAPPAEPAPPPATPKLAVPAATEPAQPGPKLTPPSPPAATLKPSTPPSFPSTSAAVPGVPAAPAPSATLTPSAPVLAPAPETPNPSIAAPAPFTPLPGVVALPTRPTDNPPLSGADLEGLSKGIKVANPAELSVEILPGPDISLGSKVSFRIATKKPGYLILVDVDAAGKLTQIYPNPMSLMGKGERDSANFIRPGKPIQVPNPSDVLSGFEFVASPPLGTAMVVALLSDRPVQMIDLPDVPSSLLGRASAADHLSKLTNELRIPDPNRTGAFQEAHWSFDAKFYAIR